MTPDDREAERDEELQRLLARWTAPVVPGTLDESVLAAFRRQTGAGAPWWARLFTASVRVPVPVALGVVLLLFVTAAFALRPPPPPPTAGAPGPADTVQTARRTEPPVVTPTNLAGFRPLAEVTATVVTGATETMP
jgi:hypothetical protein